MWVHHNNDLKDGKNVHVYVHVLLCFNIIVVQRDSSSKYSSFEDAKELENVDDDKVRLVLLHDKNIEVRSSHRSSHLCKNKTIASCSEATIPSSLVKRVLLKCGQTYLGLFLAF